jgi:1,4-alpha-glucan branching enzyme
MNSRMSPVINRRKKMIEFHIMNPCARSISVAGSFNKWAREQYPLEHTKDGFWKVEIPMLPQGQYKYKFFIDEHMEMEDIENPKRQPDGIMGFYSLLEI